MDHTWTAPSTAPVRRPPASAAPRLSTGPIKVNARNPPSGKPRKDTIQRRVTEARLGFVTPLRSVLTSDMGCSCSLVMRVVGSGSAGRVRRSRLRAGGPGARRGGPDEYVEQVGVTAKMSVGEGDELALPGRPGVLGGPHEDCRFVVDERGGYEQGR